MPSSLNSTGESTGESTSDTSLSSSSSTNDIVNTPASGTNILSSVITSAGRPNARYKVGPKTATKATDDGKTAKSPTAAKKGTKKTMLVRMGTYKFNEYRQREMDEGRGELLPGAWSKMAIVRIHRHGEPKLR